VRLWEGLTMMIAGQDSVDHLIHDGQFPPWED